MTAQQQGGSNEPVSRLIDSISRVDLRVRDIERAVSFYRDVVGLEPAESNDGRAALRGADGSVVVGLNADGVDSPAKRNATGLFHTAFRYADRATLGLALARLVEARLEVGAGDHGVSEALYVDDPDGNGVELYWDRPRETWPPPAPGQRVAMYTAAVDLRGLLDEGGRREGAGDPPVIGHVHLQAKDVEETTRFYVDGLGLDLMARMGASAAFLASNGYHHHIGANTWNSLGAEPAPRNHAGLDRIVFEVTSPIEIETARTRLEATGVAFGAANGALVVRDPNAVELVFR